MSDANIRKTMYENQIAMLDPIDRAYVNKKIKIYSKNLKQKLDRLAFEVAQATIDMENESKK